MVIAPETTDSPSARATITDGLDEDPGDSGRAELEALWVAGRGALGHGADLARIHMWRVAARVRRTVVALLVQAMLAACLAAMAITIAVWATLGFLREVSALAGGGLSGLALSLGCALALVFAVALLGRLIAARTRAARRRAKLSGAGRAGSDRAAPGDDGLAALERRTLDDLQRDRQRLVAHTERFGKAHPITTLGVSAATGFLAARAVSASPWLWRRGLTSALGLRPPTLLRWLWPDAIRGSAAAGTSPSSQESSTSSTLPLP